MGMGGQVKSVGEHQWSVMPLYKKVNHLVGHAFEMFDSYASTAWVCIVASMLLLHKDPSPYWFSSRIGLFFNCIAVCALLSSFFAFAFFFFFGQHRLWCVVYGGASFLLTHRH